MCTALNENWLEELRKMLLKKEPIVAYKVLRVIPVSINQVSFISPYQTPSGNICSQLGTVTSMCIWRNGENISNRTETELTQQEINERSVLKGFHCFLNETDAIYYCDRFRKSYEDSGNGHKRTYSHAIVNVTINPKNVVCVGVWDTTKANCVVATKVDAKLNQYATVKPIEPIEPLKRIPTEEKDKYAINYRMNYKINRFGY